MPVELVCAYCGYVFYRGWLRNGGVVAREYGYRCPKCLSPIGLNGNMKKEKVGKRGRRGRRSVEDALDVSEE